MRFPCLLTPHDASAGSPSPGVEGPAEPSLDQLAIDRRWPVPPPPPVRLVAELANDAPPELTAITSRIHALCGGRVRVLGEPQPTDSDLRWIVALKLDALSHPLIVWLAPPTSTDVIPAGDQERPWHLSFESQLHEDDPLTTYINLQRLLAATAPDLRRLIDPEISRQHGPRELKPLLRPDFIELPAGCLFDTTVIPFESGKRTIRTRGLWRCHRPDLEMHDVEANAAHAARLVLDHLAELMLDHPPGIPGEHYQLGEHLRVTLHRADRRSNPGAIGPCAAAVVCDESPDDEEAREWSYPRRLLESVRAGEAAIYRTRRSTNRQARVAQSTWPRIVSWANRRATDEPRSNAGFLRLWLKVAFARPADRLGEDHEHLWFDAPPPIDPGKPKGTLLNQPAHREDLQPGDELVLDPNAISDWIIEYDSRRYGPDKIEKIEKIIRSGPHGAGLDSDANEQDPPP